MPQLTQFNQGRQDGSVTPPPSPPFKLNGNIYRTQVETVVTDGNIKSSAIQLQKEVTTRSGKDFVTYATSNDGGKTWVNGSGGKGSTSLSTDSGLTADEVKGLQPGGNLNKATVNAANQSAIKAGASKTQQNQLKAGNDTNAQNPTTATDEETPTTVAEGIKEAAGTRNEAGTYGSLTYPLDIKSTAQDVIRFTIQKYQPGGLNISGALSGGSTLSGNRENAIRTSLGTITLAIPGGISDTNTVNWGNNELDAFTAVAQNAALTAIQDGLSKGAGILGQAAGGTSTPSGNQDTKDSLAAAIAAVATQGSATAIIGRTQGAVFNPNLELLFNGPDLRGFNFTFKMSARSKLEADEIVKIIRAFKQSMSVQKTTSSIFLKAPNTYKIEYLRRTKGGDGGTIHTRIGRIKECALRSLTTNYAPEGQYAVYNDGTPISYEIQMQFAELEPVFNSDYGNNSTEIGF